MGGEKGGENLTAGMLMSLLFATLAFVFGTSANFNCRMVEFPKDPGAPNGEGPFIIETGLFGYKTKGYYLGQDYVWISDVCRPYTDIADDFGYTYSLDSKSKAIQGLAITIIIIGGIALIGGCVSPCFTCFQPMLWNIYGYSFLLMGILQGVTLIVMNSSVCVDNPVMQYLEDNHSDIRENYPQTCQWGMGFKMGISATVFWCVAGIGTLMFHHPNKPNEFPFPGGLPASEALQVEEMAKEKAAEKEKQDKAEAADEDVEKEEQPKES